MRSKFQKNTGNNKNLSNKKAYKNKKQKRTKTSKKMAKKGTINLPERTKKQ